MVESEPVGRAQTPRRSFFWQRCIFLVPALVYALMIALNFAGVRALYFVPTRHSHEHPLVGVIFDILWWVALTAAALADAAIAIGLLRRHYQHLLYVTLAGTVIPMAFLALIESFLSIYIGAGYIEPLLLWLLIVYQLRATLSAFSEEPPPTLRLAWPPHPFHALGTSRWSRATHAAWHELQTSGPQEPGTGESESEGGEPP